MTVSRRGRLLLLTALLSAPLLAACAAGSEEPRSVASDLAPPATTATPGGGAESSGIPGLYITEDVVVASATRNGVVFASTRTCDDLSAMLASGQWRVIDRLSLGALGEAERAMLAGFGGVAGDLLQRGDESVFVGLDGVEDCTAIAAPVSLDPITLEGADMPGASPGWTTTTRCYVSASTGDLVISVYFDTDAGIGGLGQLSLQRSGDGYIVTPEDADGLNINLIRHGGRLLSEMTGMFSGAAPGEIIPLEPGEGFGGSVTLEADPAAPAPSGEVVLRGLVDANSYDSEVTLALSFACPRVIETV